MSYTINPTVKNFPAIKKKFQNAGVIWMNLPDDLCEKTVAYNISRGFCIEVSFDNQCALWHHVEGISVKKMLELNVGC